jgi:hypothetical protein
MEKSSFYGILKYMNNQKNQQSSESGFAERTDLLPVSYKLEDHVNDWVKTQFDRLKLKNQQDYYTESAIPDYLKDALKGRAKTANKTNFGKPDFSLTKYELPIIIENKLGSKKLINEAIDGVRFDEKSVNSFAVNGALHYATGMISTGKYHEVVAIGIAGDSAENIELKIYYVYGSGETSYKLLRDVKTLDFLENQNTFEQFYKNARLSEDEKHDILINSQATLQKYAKSLNKLMHNHNITAPQRVLYISGMLLSMQGVFDIKGDKVQDGLTPDDLKGIQSDTKRDGIQIVNQIKEFLVAREIPTEKQSLMLSSFFEISKDPQRDELGDLDKEVSSLINGKASSNKQIFTFIYNNIFLSIDAMVGHLDIMGEMYSGFLKYALGDGKEIGIVLTPPYITKLMATILDINKDTKVMDLATGSAGFLISSMELMIQDAELSFGKKTSSAEKKIKEIKSNQLLGIELNAEMFTLAATNMVLRGDGSSNIQKGNTFNTPEDLYINFRANRLLLNPPFSYSENGMPFIAFGLEKMEKGGLGAIIIQDSAGSGKAITTNKSILKKHTLIASIKMPTDLFQPMAGVQTSIYIFEAHRPHDFEKTVKFIDFRNDGYKRTQRSLQEIDGPAKRYSDIVKIYKAGKSAKIESKLKIDNVYKEDFITDSGSDWNFDQHKSIDTKPTLQDFKKTVGDYLAWEVSNILKGRSLYSDDSEKIDNVAGKKLRDTEWGEYRLGDLFEIGTGSLLQSKELINGNIPRISAKSDNNGIIGYFDTQNLVTARHFENFITVNFFGTDGGIFYHPYKASVEMKVHTLKIPNIEFNTKTGNFIASALRLQLKGFSYGNQLSSSKLKNSDFKIQLPTKNGGIDFDFIEEFIAELEAQHIAELEAYLKVVGLNG